MKISYEYPVVILDEDDPEISEISYRRAVIRPIRLKKEPYEVIIEASGYQFHLLFGSQINGNFLCIPDWHMGCELAHLDDISWNIDSILRTDSKLDYEDATAIVYALQILNDHIKSKSLTGA